MLICILPFAHSCNTRRFFMNGYSAMWVTVSFSLENMYILVQVMSQFQTQEIVYACSYMAATNSKQLAQAVSALLP